MKHLSQILIVIIVISFFQILYALEIQPEMGCQTNPAVIDKCFSFRGRLTIYNGTPGVRIWQINTKNLYGVLPSENEIMPEYIRKYLNYGTYVYGDFLVCPLTKKVQGRMQMVCIESASNLVIEQYSGDKKKPKVFSTGGKCDLNLGEWLNCNEPKVIDYLLSLKKKYIGKKLKGVRLSDNNCELKGYTYLGKIFDSAKKARIYLFKKNKSDIVAYIWIERNGSPLPLPGCDEKNPRSQLPGWGGSALSGDVYAYPDVHPGVGLVITNCPDKEWIERLRPD